MDYSLHCSQALLLASRDKRLLDTRHGIWMENLPLSMIHRSPPFSKLISWNLTMFLHLPQTFTTPLLDHHTPLNNSKNSRLYYRFKFKSSRNPCMEQCPDYTNVLFQNTQDPWEDFQSLLHTDNPQSWWRKISASWSISRPETNTLAQAPIWERDRRRITIALSIYSMIANRNWLLDKGLVLSKACFLLLLF